MVTEAIPFNVCGTFSAVCVAVYDGDTVTVAMKFRQEQPELFKIRMLGINAPEIKTRKKDKAGNAVPEADRQKEKAAGIAAGNFLREKILNKDIRVDCTGFDHFGRVLGRIFFNGEDMSEMMLNNDHAVKFMV